MHFEFRYHIAHQMYQWVKLVMISHPENSVPQWGIEPLSLTIRAGIITLDHQDT